MRVSIQNRGGIDGQGSGKLVNTGSEEVTLKKHNNMSSTKAADYKTTSDCLLSSSDGEYRHN